MPSSDASRPLSTPQGRAIAREIGGSVDRQQLVADLFGHVRELSRQSVALSADMAADLDAHPTDINAVHLLGVAPTPMSASELGQALGLSSAATTGLVDRLEAHNLATRIPDPNDRRRTLLRTTDYALEMVMRHLQPLFERFTSAASNMSEAELRAAADFLDQLTSPAENNT